MESNDIKQQKIILENREKLELNGVKNVLNFSDDYLELSTILGDVCVEGCNLRIQELCKESGKIEICGEINGIFYKTTKQSKGLFSGFFK